jgi:lysophospholipase L1-like esterase
MRNIWNLILFSFYALYVLPAHAKVGKTLQDTTKNNVQTIAYDKIPQPKYTLMREYGFVSYSQNQILMSYPRVAMEQFYTALEELIDKQRQKVNIVHFGDSHIQADYFSGQVRAHFNDEILLGNGGRGYFFPCLLAQGGYAPATISVSYKGVWTGCKNVQLYSTCSWGLSGMTSTTNDSTAFFKVDPSSHSNHAYQITRAKIYYPVNDPKMYSVKVLTPKGAIYPCRLDAHGFAEFCFDEPLNQVIFHLEKQYKEQNTFTLEGVSLENDEIGVQYSSVGVNSASVPSFLKSPKLEQHLHSLEADLVIISLGTNDAYGLGFDEVSFKNQYAKLIKSIKNAAPNASILLTTPGDCALPGGMPNPSNLKANKAIKELAQEYNCAVWDLFAVMGGLGSVKHWLKNQLTALDQVHFSGKGYRLQGDLLYDALIQDYGFYKQQKK